jgi:hypothetical protein
MLAAHCTTVPCCNSPVEVRQLVWVWPSQHTQPDVDLWCDARHAGTLETKNSLHPSRPAPLHNQFVSPLVLCVALNKPSVQSAHHLQIATAAGAGDEAGARPHIVNDWPIKPWNHQVCPLLVDL